MASLIWKSTPNLQLSARNVLRNEKQKTQPILFSESIVESRRNSCSSVMNYVVLAIPHVTAACKGCAGV